MSITSRRSLRTAAAKKTNPNLLLGKQFTCSTTSTSPVANVTDGSTSTKWVSAASDGVTLTVDMGDTYQLSKVVIVWDGTTTKNYQVQTSADSWFWTSIYTGTTTNTASETVTITSFTYPSTGQYLRVVCTDRWTTGAGNTIYEIEAYGTAGTTAPQSLTATPAATSIAYSWQAPARVSGTFVGYNVYQGQSLMNTTPITATSYTATGLDPSTQYVYLVRTVTSTGIGAEAVSITSTTAAAGMRNMYLQPFSSTSIWNRPIGSGAVMASCSSLAVAKGGTWFAPKQGHSVDESFIVLDPNAGATARLMERSYWWPYPDAAKEAANPSVDTGVDVLVPADYLIPNPGGSTPNNMSAMLKSGAPAYMAQECQYVVRPTAGASISFHQMLRGLWDLRGEGINDAFGSHGGAGMCCVGGTIRGGELTGAAPIAHALSMTINMRKWGCKNGGLVANGFCWPAQTADEWATNATHGYGDNRNGQDVPLINPGVAIDGMGMGTLLALPSNLDLNTLSFETGPGRKLADAMKNYGAYVVDTSEDLGEWDVWLWNLDKAANLEYPALTESYSGGNPGMNSPLCRDLDKIITRLCIVTNNAAGGTCSGGGTPIAPIAPALA